MKKIKNLLFEIEFEGQNIVNYDSIDQKYVHIDGKTYLQPRGNDNINYAKKNFKTGPNGETEWSIKMSSDFIRNTLFKEDLISKTQNIHVEDYVLYSTLFSIPYMLRGWLELGKTEQLKRSSSLNIIAAEQTNNAKSHLETFSKQGEKTDNSFYKKETVGNITYKAVGNFDIMNLQFFSGSQLHDRYSFNPDKFDIIKSVLEKRIPSFKSEIGDYKLINSVNDLAETGFLLSEDNVVFLIKEGLKRILVLNKYKRDAYAYVKSLKIKLVYDPFLHTPTNPNDWIEIKSIQDINNLNFEIKTFYEFVDPDDAKEMNQKLIQNQIESKKRKEQNKIDKQEKAKQKKEAKLNQKQ